MNNNVFIIAEAGVNHNGDIKLAKKLIDVAVDAGVDAVKFQTWVTELIATNDVPQAQYQIENTENNQSQFDMLKKLELSFDDFREIKKYCDMKNIMFLSTADEKVSANFLLELQDIFKVGSGEVTNIPFLRYLGSLDKQIILSTGICTLSDIEIAINTLIDAGTKRDNISILHVTTQYPTPMDEVNLNAMLTIKNAFKMNIGYSDHTMGIEISIAAVALGAKIIEKHFTLSRDLEGPDHKASLEPLELKEMVKSIRNIEVALGDGIKKLQKSEILNKEVVKKFIIASKTINKGDLFTEENLFVKRSNGIISSSKWDDIIGLRANKNYYVDEPIIF